MNSHDVQDNGGEALATSRDKKPWITPSLQIIALKSAESGTRNSHIDGTSSHFTHARS
jgi:hypothetical protein